MSSTATPFNDTKETKVDYRAVTSVSGSDTSAFDQFRQGVELRNNFYFMGAVKIHSGFPEHVLAQNKFGQARPPLVDQDWFFDLDTYGPDTFIQSHPQTQGALRSCESVFSKVTRNPATTFEFAMDGVLEPLVIRARVSFLASASYKDTRNVFVRLADGNDIADGRNDQIVSVYELKENVRSNEAAFLDQVGSLGNVTLPGIVDVTPNRIIPWIDNPVASGSITSTRMDSDFRSKVLALGSRQDNYVPTSKKAMTSGFSFDTKEGTDSIAFGGFYYISSSVSRPPIG